ncbi:MAG TPA: hypothetical protein VJ044_01475, partial [Candidatus Hodarchaeales archaeon]|nr:hypothetical protein [Candidatus Hodarchaeales archaeon]
MPYCLAVALIYGDVRIGDFVDDAIRDLQIVKLMELTKVLADPDLEREGYVEGAIVTVRTKNNRFEKRVNKAKGTPENPLTDEELLRKFHLCASVQLSDRATGALSELIMNLERVDDVSEIVDLACDFKHQ